MSLEQSDRGVAVLEDQPVLRRVAGEDLEAELLVEGAGRLEVLDREAHREVPERHGGCVGHGADCTMRRAWATCQILRNSTIVDRVNRAIDYVTRNLSEPLKLEEVAKVASFSPYHFHRIFRALVGETLHDFVKRVRLERALYLISHGDRPAADRDRARLRVRLELRLLAQLPRTFRRVAARVRRRQLPPRAARRDDRRRCPDDERLARCPAGSNPDGFTVRLRDLPARRVAYLRVFRPYEGDRVPEATTRLVAWARERGLAGGQWLGYQWDDPEIVPLDLVPVRHRRRDPGDSHDRRRA